MMARARAALTITLFGIGVSPFLGVQYGSAAGVGVSAAFAAAGIALRPEPNG